MRTRSRKTSPVDDLSSPRPPGWPVLDRPPWWRPKRRPLPRARCATAFGSLPARQLRLRHHSPPLRDDARRKCHVPRRSQSARGAVVGKRSPLRAHQSALRPICDCHASAAAGGLVGRGFRRFQSPGGDQGSPGTGEDHAQFRRPDARRFLQRAEGASVRCFRSTNWPASAAS